MRNPPRTRFGRFMRRGSSPSWWAPMCLMTCLLNLVTVVTARSGVIEVALATGALALVGFAIVTVSFFRAPRLYP